MLIRFTAEVWEAAEVARTLINSDDPYVAKIGLVIREEIIDHQNRPSWGEPMRRRVGDR